MMDKDEPFVYDEVAYKTPKQSPQTWPMDKIRQGRFPHKMSSLLSPVTPKRNYSISNAKSLLLQCLRDAKSDPLPRRRFPVSCSDERILMDGVMVTSATKKKVSESPSSSVGGSATSSILRSQHKKNIEFSSPISESGRNEETTRSQQSSSAGKGKMLEYSPCTPKAVNPSKLQASAEPFVLTPRRATPFPLQQPQYNPQFPCANPLHLQPYPYLHRPRPLIYLYQRPPLLPPPSHGLDPYMLNSRKDFPPILFGNQSPTKNNRPRYSLPTTPSSSQPNTTTSDPPGSSPSVGGLESVTPIPDLSSTPSDGLTTVTHKPDLSPPFDEVETVTQKADLSPPSDELETVTPDLSSASVGVEKVTQEPDLPSPFAGLQTMKIKKDWSPSDDRLPTFTQAQLDFMTTHNRLFPDSVFGRYKYKKRMSAFKLQEEHQ
ncbi:hypothetical protein CARUB_v10028332mg [Capsella rubella]|uniref:Uncharacterized protein n=1 Tax=Capsella rubella TaxID=81985 RepID=R0GE59_9BRAS|nr:mucin-2 [Capsella rubella]XP_023645553.1 mucin-2 [Capsella rubella]EOA14984.1 hypothetical protein CARUB_v10028332mg [Capsella rubella]